MNDDTTQGVTLPDVFDFSNGASNSYLVEARHRLIPPCPYCGEFRPVLLDGSQYYHYFVSGTAGNIQHAFPNLTAPQREVLMTGIHPQCWDALFADEGDSANE